ncbi:MULTISPECIES: hypothetical protein [unclassified Campylobacter]|nr:MULTISPECIES: hypothetical protein [unclassified Campylobacter]
MYKIIFLMFFSSLLFAKDFINFEQNISKKQQIDKKKIVKIPTH